MSLFCHGAFLARRRNGASQCSEPTTNTYAFSRKFSMNHRQWRGDAEHWVFIWLIPVIRHKSKANIFICRELIIRWRLSINIYPSQLRWPISRWLLSSIADRVPLTICNVSSGFLTDEYVLVRTWRRAQRSLSRRIWIRVKYTSETCNQKYSLNSICRRVIARFSSHKQLD